MHHPLAPKTPCLKQALREAPSGTHLGLCCPLREPGLPTCMSKTHTQLGTHATAGEGDLLPRSHPWGTPASQPQSLAPGLACPKLATPALKIGLPARPRLKPWGKGGERSPQSSCPQLLEGPPKNVRQGRGLALWTPWPKAGCPAPGSIPSQPHPRPVLPNQPL